jgi:uncharacterized protein
VESTPRFDPAGFEPALQTRLLILQPTPFCNIDCSYCYLPERGDRSRMTVETVAAIAQRLLDDRLLGPELSVVWHAGEPLAAPPDFYEAAFGALQQTLGAHTELTHCIQTNATLIDERWCELFLRHGVKIGVSIDGPAALHDRHRRTRGGRGTHERVMHGVDLLRRHGIPFHAIAVVTAATLQAAEDFARFFIELAPTELGLNFDEAEGANPTSSLAGHEDAHGHFLRALLPHMQAGRLVLRELAQALQLVAQPLPSYRWAGEDWPDNAQLLPYALLNVAWNGDFGTFSPELLGQPSLPHGNFVLGNVFRQGLFEAARGPAFARLWAPIREGVRGCRDSCAHYAWCGGGSPVNKLYEAGSLAATETLYCRTMLKRPFDIALQSLEADLAATKKKGSRSRPF